MSAVKDLCTAAPGENRRLELELGARFEGSCGFALVLAPSQKLEHGLGPFGRADLHPRRNPLDRQGRFAPQPGSDSQLGGGAVRSLRSKVQGPKLGWGRNQKTHEARRWGVLIVTVQHSGIVQEGCTRMAWHNYCGMPLRLGQTGSLRMLLGQIWTRQSSFETPQTASRWLT